MDDLARRAVACWAWQWMPGMRTTVGAQVVRVYGTGGFDLVSSTGALYVVEDVDADELPDLTDPATLGCLLHLVRQAHEDDKAHLVWDHGRWTVQDHRWIPIAEGGTEAAALVAALEAADDLP